MATARCFRCQSIKTPLHKQQIHTRSALVPSFRSLVWLRLEPFSTYPLSSWPIAWTLMKIRSIFYSTTSLFRLISAQVWHVLHSLRTCPGVASWAGRGRQMWLDCMDRGNRKGQSEYGDDRQQCFCSCFYSVVSRPNLTNLFGPHICFGQFVHFAHPNTSASYNRFMTSNLLQKSLSHRMSEENSTNWRIENDSNSTILTGPFSNQCVPLLASAPSSECPQ